MCVLSSVCRAENLLFRIVKEKYGSDGDEDEDSENAESEDEDGEELTPAVDAAILRTLVKIKRRDPEIYEIKKNIFEGMCVFRGIGIAFSFHCR
jgi:hypothetical protein